ncbi:MAG: hypothetical protein L0H83_15725, partial [Salinisphaera sp.]|nr:hypothetical protein [Salinisphaera sp.]
MTTEARSAGPSHKNLTIAAPQPAGLFRRVAAASYDLFLLAGLWFVAVAALLPFTGGAALDGHNLWF